jgi:hypothetical protein
LESDDAFRIGDGCSYFDVLVALTPVAPTKLTSDQC